MKDHRQSWFRTQQWMKCLNLEILHVGRQGKVSWAKFPAKINTINNVWITSVLLASRGQQGLRSQGIISMPQQQRGTFRWRDLCKKICFIFSKRMLLSYRSTIATKILVKDHPQSWLPMLSACQIMSTATTYEEMKMRAGISSLTY